MLIIVLVLSVFEAIALINVKMAEKPKQANTSTMPKRVKLEMR